MDQKYDEERERIYQEVRKEKLENQRMSVVKSWAKFMVEFPQMIYIFLSALIVTGALALQLVTLSYGEVMDILIQGDFGSLVAMFLFVALLFLIWLMFGVFCFWNDRHRDEIYEKVVRRQKRL